MQADPIPQTNYFILSSGLMTTSKGRKSIAEKKEMLCERVELNHNRLDSVIKDIKHIDFLGTIFLQLSYNNISSIEAIRNLKAPYLQDLHLSYNEITRISSLAKANFPKLKTLSLMKNPIIDEQALQLAYFPSLNKLLLDDPREKNKKFAFQSSSLLVKSFPRYIEAVRWNTQKIKQGAIDAMLLKKNPAPKV